jgi:drug/metabolite transporter (DMT)-like permease
MAFLIAILIGALILEAIGVIFTSIGLKKLRPMQGYSFKEVALLVIRALTNRDLLLGIGFQALFFFALLYLLSQGDVSFIWPLTALSFVFTTIAARFYLREQIPRLRWLGLILIVFGAMLITYSEAKKQEQGKPRTQQR